MFGSIAAGAASGINEEEWRASRRSPVQQFLSTNEADATSDPDSISALRNRTPNPDNNNSSFIVQESDVEGGPRTLRVNIDESAVIVPQLDQSWLAEDDEEDDQELETILESYLKELLVATGTVSS
ncbi:hypothetical protein HDU79_003008 [Rhizoclosmatium sp. JEL0117]|nr:hypothetical protein HDU79_003008 [Rhizoclosmatium sp. JEL0117]